MFRQRLDLVTLGVASPYPAALWITLRQSFLVKQESARIVFRVVILRDKDQIGSFAVLLDSAASAAPYEYTFDAFAGVSPLPETMLISAQAEVILLPAGTDLAQIDANTYKGDPDTAGTVLSNPVRINLGTPCPTQAAPAPPASTAGKESP